MVFLTQSQFKRLDLFYFFYFFEIINLIINLHCNEKEIYLVPRNYLFSIK